MHSILTGVDQKIIQAVDRAAVDNRDHLDNTINASVVQVVDEVVSKVQNSLTTLQITTVGDLDRVLSATRIQLRDDIMNHVQSSQTESLARLESGFTSSIDDITSRIDDRFATLRSDFASSSQEGRLAIESLQTSLVTYRPESEVRTVSDSNFMSFEGRNADPWAMFLRQSAARARFSNPGCEASCICQCHSASAYGNWEFSWFNDIIGSICVSYRGFLSKPKPCSSRKCHSVHKPKWIRLDYVVPQWLLKIAFTLFVSICPAPPEMPLRVVRQIPPDTISFSQSIFGLVRRGDIDGIKRALQTRRACVSDIYLGPPSFTALTLAVSFENVAMAKLLLDAGSDEFFRCDFLSPITRALSHFCKGLPSGKILLEMLPVSEFLEVHEYSDLHKIMYGFLPLNLKEALRKPHFLAQVNQCASNGMAPIHVAAQRGDSDAIEALIEAGAIVDSETSGKMTPLAYACRNGKLAAAQTLLARGAAVTHTDLVLATCLHKAAGSDAQGPALLSLLISCGADVNARNINNAEPLTHAVWGNLWKSVKVLLQHGADVNNRDWEGDVALSDAISSRSHQSAQILLNHGVNYGNVNNYGWGTLHKLAANGDELMMQLFTKIRMRGVDRNLRNLAGKTAMDLFEERDEVSNDLRKSFEELLDSLVEDDSDVDEGEDQGDIGSSDDEFFDALDA